MKIIFKTMLTLLFTMAFVFTTEANTEPQKHEFRGAWVATVGNIDWPTKKGLSVEEQKLEFIQIVSEAEKMNLNALVVQIRPTADAFYKSKINPWSEFLSGTEGADPGYDPLEFMINECHKRNIEFHAWFNPYRVSNNNSTKVYSDGNIKNLKPEWMVSYENKMYINPGIPEARKYIIDSIMEVVENYDVDAIHFDDYFYPYPSKKDFPDDSTYKIYNTGNFKDKESWRRNNVDSLIKEVYESIKSKKPYVKLGISPFGVWRNKANDPSGSDTTAGVTSYDGLHADTRSWIQNGWVDYMVPQIYWEFTTKPAQYDKVLKFWTKELAPYPDIHLYVGHASYKISSWKKSNELPNQLDFNKTYLEVKGSVYYNITSLIKNPKGFKNRLINNYYKYPALLPSYKNPDGTKMSKVTISNSVTEKNNNIITFSSKDKDIKSFVVYRSTENFPIDINKANRIYKIIPNNNMNVQYFYDEKLESGKTYNYVITAIDRFNNESPVSSTVSLTAR